MKGLWMVMALAVAAPTAWADEPAIGSDTHVAVGVDDFTAHDDAAAHYSPGDKLVRGLANVFTGFIEIPRNIFNTTQERNLLEGWTVGLAKGVGYTGLRMLSGAYETVTFPFPVPRNYEPVIRPEYVWEASGPSYIGSSERRSARQVDRNRESGT